MKKSFGLVLVPAVSAAMLALGCGDPSNQQASSDYPQKVCVDKDGTRMPDDRCRDERYTGGSHPFYYWYYLSRGGRVPPLGATAHGGSFGSSEGAHASGISHGSTSHASGISRGGFGSSAHGFGIGG